MPPVHGGFEYGSSSVDRAKLPFCLLNILCEIEIACMFSWLSLPESGGLLVTILAARGSGYRFVAVADRPAMAVGEDDGEGTPYCCSLNYFIDETAPWVR